MKLKEDSTIKNRSYFVAKSNQLITKSRYSLSLQQQKILLYFISRIKPGDEAGKVYELSIKEFGNVCGYVENSGYYYQSIKEDIKKLRDVSSWIEISPGREVLFSWIDTAEINAKEGNIKVTFHSTVSPYLFELRERYTQYSLFNVLCLSHKYSIRLYEYLCAMKYTDGFTISVDELRKRLGAETYTRFTHFRERVLEPSVLDIDKYTDIFIEYDFIKTGKAVTDIRFKFHEKSSSMAAITGISQDMKISPKERKARKEVIKALTKEKE